jgi:hypothetical protein
MSSVLLLVSTIQIQSFASIDSSNVSQEEIIAKEIMSDFGDYTFNG